VLALAGPWEVSTILTFTHSIGPDVLIRFSDKPDERIRGMLKQCFQSFGTAHGDA
jgi:hypothetical protein